MAGKKDCRHARSAELDAFARSGFCFVLGLAAVVFMGVLCVRREAGAGQMLLLLDAAQLIHIIYLLIAPLRMKRLRAGELAYVRAAVERYADGSARVVYACGGVRYELFLPQSTALPPNGMADVWYDPAHPAVMFLGKRPQPSPAREHRYVPVLLALTAGMNALFFLC